MMIILVKEQVGYVVIQNHTDFIQIPIIDNSSRVHHIITRERQDDVVADARFCDSSHLGTCRHRYQTFSAASKRHDFVSKTRRKFATLLSTITCNNCV